MLSLYLELINLKDHLDRDSVSFQARLPIPCSGRAHMQGGIRVFSSTRLVVCRSHDSIRER